MCTIILASRVLDDTPLVFAANRDEQLDRPAAPPKVHDDRSPRVVAPVDLKAGGTWLGINEHGLLVAITNRFGRPPDRARKSRGNLVFAALEAPTARAASDVIAALPATDYNPFHLVFADAGDCRIVWSDGSEHHRVAPAPGVLVVTERSFGAAKNERADFLERHTAQLRERGELDVPHLRELLSIRRRGDIDATCVLIPEMNYGTRSSTIIDPAREIFLHADGPPCEVDYDDLGPMLSGLLNRNSIEEPR